MPDLCASIPPARSELTIQSFADVHRAALLSLNAANVPAVAQLDETSLAHLLGFGGHHLVAVDRTGRVLGYLLSFSRDSAYDDSEICELRRRLAGPFFYICQVVIAPEHRGRQIGRTFYGALADTARRQGAQFLCCDVNTNPPNPESLAFHHRLGFVEIGAGTASNGFAIAFLARRL